MTGLVETLAAIGSSPALALVVKATIVCVAALALAAMARHAGAASRHLLFAITFLVLFGLPLGLVVAPLDIAIATPPNAAPVRPLHVVAGQEPASQMDVDVLTAIGAVAAPSSRSWPSTATVASVVWLLGAMAFALPMAIGAWQLRRLRRNGLPWTEGIDLVAAAAQTQGVRRRIAVLRDTRVSAPLTFGVVRPVMVFPADIGEWTARDLECAIAHEVAHVRRGDWLTHCLARLVCAAYWFHPLVWAAWRKLGLEAERAADDIVLTHADAAGYADQLVSLAQRLSDAEPSRPVMAMANRSDLSARVASVLDSKRRRDAVRGVAQVAAVVCAAVMTALVGPLRFVAVVEATGASANIAVASASLAVAQSSAPLPSFDVASIRQNRSGEQTWSMRPLPGGRVELINVPLRIVIRAAYGGLQEYELVGGPNWLDNERYDIVATAAGNPPQSQLFPMVRTLLADRFQLQLREDTRELPIYSLVLTRPGTLGPQLRRAAPCFTAPQDAPAQTAPPPGSPPPCGSSNRAGGLAGRGVTLDRVAFSLSSRAGRMVVNRTGVQGEYDFDLTFAPDPSNLDTAPSIFTAVQEQLGLRLEPGRGPVQVFVIDRIERPTPNSSVNFTSSPVPAAGTPPRANAQTSEQPDLRFDVASVRANTSDSSSNVDFTPGRFTAINVTLWDLIKMAYPAGERLRSDDQIDGGPGWIRTNRFDLMATGAPLSATAIAPGAVAPPESATVNQVRAMLRNLLAERFGLAVRVEDRQLPVYALTRMTPDSAGKQLRPAAQDCATDAGTASAGSPACGGFRLGGGRLAGRSVTMPMLVSLLGGLPMIGRPVEDRTGLAGTFDIELTWAPQQQPRPGEPDPAPLGPSIFTAFQEQLGLKLEATRGPVEVLVIERAQVPTPN